MGLEHFILILTTCSVPVPSHIAVSVLYRLIPVICYHEKGIFCCYSSSWTYFNVLYFGI